MAWNEPGGNSKDPWSGRDQKDNPPDLDDVMRNLQARLGGLFGGAGGGGQSGGDPVAGARWLGAVGVAALGLWALTGIYIVDEGNRGVVTRFGRYLETTLPGPHWHLPTPLETVTVVNVEQQRFVEVGYRSGGRSQLQGNGNNGSNGSVPREALMLTQDENIVDLRLAVQYQIKDARDYIYNMLDPEGTLKQVTESAERSVIGKSTMDYVLTEGRSSIAEDIKSEIQQALDQYRSGIRVITVNLVDAQPPEEVQAAFEDAIKAREDEQRLKNEAEAYANEVVPKARGAASRLQQESEAYRERVVSRATGEAARFSQLQNEYQKAPEVTRERLYLETMQDVLGRAHLTVVDVDKGNNIIYLPVDRPRHRHGHDHDVHDGDSAAAGTGTQQAMPARMDADEAAGKAARVTGRGRDGRVQ